MLVEERGFEFIHFHLILGNLLQNILEGIEGVHRRLGVLKDVWPAEERGQ